MHNIIHKEPEKLTSPLFQKNKRILCADPLDSQTLQVHLPETRRVCIKSIRTDKHNPGLGVSNSQIN